MMKSLVKLGVLFVLVSCSSIPKGEYSESVVERPYSLPDDVASFSIGAYNSTVKVDNIVLSSVTEDSSVANYTMLTLGLEQGISSDASWLYPLGFKYTIYDDKKHTFGLSFVTLFFVSDGSINYWYRLSDQWSIRPFYHARRLDAYIINEKKNTTGLDVVYQWNDKFALTTRYEFGNYEVDSGLVEDLLDELSDDELSTTSKGDISELKIEMLYSLNERWDLIGDFSREVIVFNDFDIITTDIGFKIKYYY